MNPPPLRLGGWHQTYLYFAGSLVILSGALWVIFHYFVRVEGDFGPTLHPLEPWWLRVHGVSAAALLIGFGSVMPGHVRRAWTNARNRISGSVFFGVMAILTLTGYLLYYIGSQSVRDVTAIFHWGIGFAMPLLAAWHVWRGRVWRRIAVTGQRERIAGNANRDGQGNAVAVAQQALGHDR